MNLRRLAASIMALILTFALCTNPAYASVAGEVSYAQKGTKLFISGSDSTLANQMVTILVANEFTEPFTPDSIKWLYQTKADASGNYKITVPVSSKDIYEISGGDYTIRVNAGGKEVTNTLNQALLLSDIYTVDAKADLQDVLTLDVSVANPFSCFDSFRAICAYYNADGNLVSTDVQTISLRGKDYSDTVEFAAIPDGVSYAKVMLWESLDTLSPLTGSDTIPLSAKTFTLAENPELITKNPGKGWVRYGSTNNDGGFVSDPVLAQKALDYSQTGYNRFTWAQIEPAEGEFNFSLIDNAIEYWDAQGVKFAFTVMTLTSANTQNAYHTPKWVFDKGAKYTLSNFELNGQTGSVYVPVYNDPIYVECFTKLVKALAERYDGDERIAFIDARIQGVYGEGHHGHFTNEAELELLSSEDIIKTLSIWADNFKQTQLVAMMQDVLNDDNYNLILEDVYDYCVEAGIGLRNDGVMSERSWYRVLAGMDQKGPVVFETAPRYNLMTADNQYVDWDPQLYLQNVYIANPSYLDLGQWVDSTEDFIENEEKLIKMLTNKIGYHFVLNEVSLDADTRGNITLGTKWQNNGRNSLFENCTVKVALLDAGGNVVAMADTDFSPREWKPSKQTTETATINFGSVDRGDYQLAIGLLLNDKDSKPDYYIGNYGRTEDGWYVVANALKTESSYVFTEYEPYIYGDGSSDNIDYEEIINGGFEGSGGWTLSGSVVTDAQYSEGTHSLKLANAMQDIYIHPEYVYTLGFDTKSTSPITYTFTDESGTVVASGTVAASGTWTSHTVNFDYFDPAYKYFGECYYDGKITLEFTAPEGADAYIDNFSITGKTPYSEYADSTNLIRDYGLELADMGWYPRTGNAVSRTTEYAHTGSYSGKIDRSSGSSNSATMDIYDILKANGAGTYRFEAYARPGGIGYFDKVAITIDGCSEQGRDDEFGYTWEYVYGIEGWKKLTHEFTITEERLAKMSNAYMLIYCGDSNTTVSDKPIYFDDARLTKID